MAQTLWDLFFSREVLRFIEFTDARAIVSSIPPFVAKIGLFVNPSRDIVEDCIKNVGIDTLQFHGDESSEFCSIFGLPWIKTISVDAKTDIKKRLPNMRMRRLIYSTPKNQIALEERGKCLTGM